MKKDLACCFRLLTTLLLSSSLIASTSPSASDSLLSFTPNIEQEEDADAASSMILGADDPMELPFEEAETNIEEDGSDPNAPDEKVLYDPKMDYGTGSPAPINPNAPISTKKRNFIAFAASLVIGTIAIAVTATNKGADAQ